MRWWDTCLPYRPFSQRVLSEADTAYPVPTGRHPRAGLPCEEGGRESASQVMHTRTQPQKTGRFLSDCKAFMKTLVPFRRRQYDKDDSSTIEFEEFKQISACPPPAQCRRTAVNNSYANPNEPQPLSGLTVIEKLAERDPGDEMSKAFTLFDDDNTGKITCAPAL